MQTSRMSDEKSTAQRAGGPPASWWWANAIAALVVSVPLLVWGLLAVSSGHTSIWYWRFGLRRVEFFGVAAKILGAALMVGSCGLFAHMFLTCFDALKWKASSFAKLAGALFLLLFIAAVVQRLI